jgi:hypothetical protein
VTPVVLPSEQFGVLMGNPILARSSCQQEDEGPCSIYWDLIISEPTHLQMLVFSISYLNHSRSPEFAIALV